VVEVEADLVVLATAVIAPKDNPALAGYLVCPTISMVICQKPIPNFARLKRPRPVFSGRMYPAPKDIPDTVAQASACAAKVCGLFAGDTLKKDPMVSTISNEYCSGCLNCVKVCPYQAIVTEEIPLGHGSKELRTVAKINEGVCQGCGSCVAVCRSMAISLAGFTDPQIINEIVAI